MGGNPKFRHNQSSPPHRTKDPRRTRRAIAGSCWCDHPREAALSGPRMLKLFSQPWSWMGRITYPGVT